MVKIEPASDDDHDHYSTVCFVETLTNALVQTMHLVSRLTHRL
jgi:hypothetical protein